MLGPKSRKMPLNSPATLVAIVAALFFLGLGLRGYLDPPGAAQMFGFPNIGEAGFPTMQAVGARNMGLALIALTLVWLDAKQAFIALLLAAALITVLDFTIVWSVAGLEQSAKHLAYAVGLAGFAAYLGAKKQA